MHIQLSKPTPPAPINTIINRAFIIILTLLVISCNDGPERLIEQDNLNITRLNIGTANVYLVKRGEQHLLIDAANPGDEKRIENQLKQLKLSPKDIDYLILTHGHIDHAGTAAYFQKQWNIKIIGGQGDQSIIDRQGRDDICPTSALATAIKIVRQGLSYEPFTLDIAIEHDFDLNVLGINGEIIHLPGHTQGSIAIRFDDQLLIGDLLRGDLMGTDTPETHFFHCDLAQNQAQISQLLQQVGDVTWYPGHLGAFDSNAVQEYLDDMILSQ